MAEIAEPGRLVHRESDVAVAADRRLARVQADPDVHAAVLRPVGVAHRALGGDGRRDGGSGAAEDEEEGVALAVDLDPAVLREGAPQQLVVPLQELPVALPPKVLEQARRALDVREQEGDGPLRELLRCGPGHDRSRR